MKRKNIKITVLLSLLVAIVLPLWLINKCLKFSDLFLENVYSTFDKVNLNEFEKDNKNYSMCVHFLDVGKADCIYIKCEDKNVLIDAADKDVSSSVVEYLCRQNVSKLDLVVLTHPHRDHMGQMSDVINSFKIDNFMMSEIPQDIMPTSNTFKKMLESIENKDLKIKLVHTGEKFVLGNLKIDILSPCRQYGDLNNNSVVMRLEYGDESFLFTGDAEKEAEKDMIKNNCNLKSTVLKVGHHGSTFSSTEQFLEKVQPKISIISVGKSSRKVLKEFVSEKIKKSGSQIYRTDVYGTIILKTNGKGIDVSTERRIA